jgi:hypothetical protein
LRLAGRAWSRVGKRGPPERLLELPCRLKLFECIHAPMTAGLLSTVPADAKLRSQSRSQDRLYQRAVDDLD